MVIGLSIVAVSYFLANLSFFSVLSNEEIIGTQAVALVSQTLGLITSQYYYISKTLRLFLAAVW